MTLTNSLNWKGLLGEGEKCTIHYLYNKYCSQYKYNYIWAIEDFLQTLLIIISLLMKFDLIEIKLILCPNLFITIVISTFFVLKEIDGTKIKRSIFDKICIVIFTPFPVCFVQAFSPYTWIFTSQMVQSGRLRLRVKFVPKYRLRIWSFSDLM